MADLAWLTVAEAAELLRSKKLWPLTRTSFASILFETSASSGGSTRSSSFR